MRNGLRLILAGAIHAGGNIDVPPNPSTSPRPHSADPPAVCSGLGTHVGNNVPRKDS